MIGTLSRNPHSPRKYAKQLQHLLKLFSPLSYSLLQLRKLQCVLIKGCLTQNCVPPEITIRSKNKVKIDPGRVSEDTVQREHLLSLKEDPNNFIFPVFFKTSWCTLTLRGTKTIKIYLNLEKSGWQPSH